MKLRFFGKYEKMWRRFVFIVDEFNKGILDGDIRYEWCYEVFEVIEKVWGINMFLKKLIFYVIDE